MAAGHRLADYAQQMAAVLDAEPGWTGGSRPLWEERPVTRFERKGVAAGRPIADLSYRRCWIAASSLPPPSTAARPRR